MGGQSGFHKLLDLLFYVRSSGDSRLENNEGLDNLGADLVRATHNGHHANGRVLYDAVLDLCRADTITRAGNQIVLSTYKPKIPVLVLFGQVSGDPPIPHILVSGRLRIFPVFQTHHWVRSLDAHFTHRSRWHRVARVVHDGHFMAWNGFSHGPRFDFHDLAAAPYHQIHFGLPIEFIDRQSHHLFAPLQEFLAQGLTAASDAPHLVVITTAGILDLPHHFQCRGGHEGVSDAVFGQEVEGLLRIKFLGPVGNHRNAMVPTWEKHIHKSAHPCPISRGPKKIILFREEIVGELYSRHVSEQDPVGMEGPLWGSGGARGIAYEGGIFRFGLNGLIFC